MVERALYNTVLAGIALDGKSFFYVNPLEVWPDNCLPRTSKEHVKPERQKWFGVACCPPNIARTLASLGQYIYGVDKESIYINLFIANEMEVGVKGSKVSICMNTRFPWEMAVDVALCGIPDSGMKLAVRIPEYAKDFTATALGQDGVRQNISHICENGYAVFQLTKDASLRMEWAAPAMFVRSNPLVRADSGKVALVRGPLVYCLEEIDNGSNLAAVYVDADTTVREEEVDLFGGITGLSFQGKKISGKNWKGHELYGNQPIVFEDMECKAIPYAYWNNRGRGEMIVWVKELVTDNNLFSVNP